MNEFLQEGFNTFYTGSVLSHVRMPEGFAVSLGLKAYNAAQVLREALIGRTGEDAEKIHPGPRGYDGGYTQLRLSYRGQELDIQSAAIDGEQYLLVTPVVVTRRAPTLFVSGAFLWNRPGTVQLDGDCLVAQANGRTIRVFAQGVPCRQLNAGLTNPYLSFTLTEPVAVSTGRPASVEELTALMARQKQRVLDGTRQFGQLAEAYNAMRTCLAWDTVYEPEKERICSPVSRIWNLNWGGYVLFDWDTYFSAMMAMLESKELAYANARAITGEKTERGFIPNFGAADGLKSRDRSQPPVGSLAVREIYRIYREKEFVGELFDDLLVWNRWFAENRMLKSGQLCWGSNPYEPVNDGPWEETGVNERFGAALESGLDNSPMYDGVPFDAGTHRMCLADVGLTGLYLRDCEALADLAEVLSRPEASELRSRAELVKDGLEGLWNEAAGIYCNRRTDTGEFSTRLSPTNFYALFSDRVSPERVQRMLQEHFYNPAEFYGEFMLPSIARNDPAYPDQDYWRGRIWAPMNYLAYLALRSRGCTEACRELAEKSKRLLLLEWEQHGHVHENYNGDTGMGCDVHNSDRFYHWGGLLALTALTEAGYAKGPEQPL